MANKNLSDFSITSNIAGAGLSSNTRQFLDLDLSLIPNPFTKDISVLRDDRAVIQAVKNLLLTNFFERPFDPLKGGNLSGFLFEPADHITRSNMKDAISRVLGKYEPRVQLLNINIVDNPDEYSYNIGVGFRIVETNLETEVQIQLRRLR